MVSISNLSAKAACDAITALCNGGSGTASAHLKIYSGTVPTDADTALGAQVLLSDNVMTNPAFAASADLNPGARATANAISDAVAGNTGTASFFRIVDRAGTCIIQGSVGTSGTECIINSTAIQSNATVSVSSLTFTIPES